MSLVVVGKTGKVRFQDVLNQFGFRGLVKIDPEVFDSVINPVENRVYLGIYKDNLIICSQEITHDFFGKRLSDSEKILTSLFAESEICSLMLHSSVNLFAYTVNKNGVKIRLKGGDGENGTYFDVGEPLEEEKELLSKSTIGEDGTRIYHLEEFPGDPMSEDQVGEDFVFRIWKRFFGVDFNREGDELFSTEMEGFKYDSITFKPITDSLSVSVTESTNGTGEQKNIIVTKIKPVEPTQKRILEPKTVKPWWQFW